MKRNILNTALVLTAGVLWGVTGIFVRALGAEGFGAIQIVFIRLLASLPPFAVLILCKDRKNGFRIRLRDLPLFLGLGIGSILFFTVCYFTAMREMSLSTAAGLLYTSPIWVMLASVFLFKNPFTLRKGTALALSFIGCVLVSGWGKVSVKGLLAGLGAGLGYAAYSILATVALKRYPPHTITFYTFLIATVGALPMSDPVGTVSRIAASPHTGRLLLLFAAAGIVIVFLPYLCYTSGLRAVPADTAAILTTVEPLVATLVGVAVFHETLTFSGVFGIFCILSAIVVLHAKKRSVHE